MEQTTQIPVRTIEDFFDNEYLGYAKYVLSGRAIPSVIDGFKPTQRKVAFVADKVWKKGDEKPMKVFQLGGRVASTAFYHHGNASLDSTIIGMAQTFKNSMPIFQGIGQFGSLRSPEAGAPRYVGVKFNENFRLLYKDFELTESMFEEGEEIEPKFFLPIIPTVLLNGSAGIAVGFATNILNRNPINLIDACLDVLNDKVPRELFPWIDNFYGSFTRATDNQNSWLIKGCYSVKNTTTVEITELPPSMTYEKYEAYLDGLTEKGVLTSYDNNSSDKINYILKFQRQILADLIKRSRLDDTLKMNERETENLTTLDEHQKLLVFDNAESIVSYFVNFRLVYYQKRKDYLIKTLTNELEVLSSRSRFIDDIVSNRLIVNNRAKKDIESDLTKSSYQKVDGTYSYLVSMPIHALTKEKFDELQKAVKSKEAELIKIKAASTTDLYRQDLNELRKAVK